MAVRTPVIVAAGIGARFLPISKSVQKEMLPLVDRPVVERAAEQAVEAGVERARRGNAAPVALHLRLCAPPPVGYPCGPA